MRSSDVLVISPFRRPDFRHAVSPSHPHEEPWDSPPFVAAAACEAAGYDTAVLALQNIYTGYDEERDIEELRRLLRRWRPRLALFAADHFIASRSTATVYGMRIVSRLLAEDRQRPLIGACGRLATTARHRLLASVPEIDFLVVGEAEQVLGDVVSRLLHGGREAAATCPAVLTRAQAGDGRCDIEPAFVIDPDALPPPAFHLAGPSIELWQRHRSGGYGPVPFSIRTSFGCKFRCKFCAGVPHWNDYRMKSKQRIAVEVDHLLNSLPGRARLSFLEDEIATRFPEHVRAFADVLCDRKIRLDGLYTHASLLTEEVAALLAPITDRVFIGLDNPDDSILRDMGKGQRLSTVLEAVQRARAAGIRTHLEWVIGSPPETADSLITSLHAIFYLLSTGSVDSINTYVYCPHPGTEYVERAKHHGVILHDEFDMLESGGYPASSTSRLSRDQIFLAYLMSQLVITEVTAARGERGTLRTVLPPVRAELARLFEQIGAPR